MEYSYGNLRLFDFVYATADTRVRRHRQKLERFFDSYKNKKDRDGEYLLAADIADPLWDSEFDSPAALRRQNAAAEAALDLLRARVREQSFRGEAIDEILQVLAEDPDIDMLLRLSEIVGIRRAHWYQGGSVSEAAVQFMNVCVEREKVEELLDAIAIEDPNVILEGG
jgi:hypothetical protein